jgi:CelD/BcsL family acetyltransferase involved in cellulose biosynthesis
LVETSGPERRWVSAREVAAVLSDRLGIRKRATSQAAGANLRRLRTDGFAEADQSEDWSRWRPTDAGAEAAASPDPE